MKTYLLYARALCSLRIDRRWGPLTRFVTGQGSVGYSPLYKQTVLCLDRGRWEGVLLNSYLRRRY